MIEIMAYRSIEVYRLSFSMFQVLVRICNFYHGGLYYLDRRSAALCFRPFILQFYRSTYFDIDDRTNGDVRVLKYMYLCIFEFPV